MYTDPSGYTWWSHFSGWVGDNWKPIVTTVAVVAVSVTVTILTAGTAAPLAVAFMAGAAGGFTGGVLGTGLNGGNLGQCLTAGLIQGAIGGVAGLAGGALGSWAGKGISISLSGTSISATSAIGGSLIGGVGGAVGGFAGGFTAGYLMTGDVDAALQMGFKGAITGGFIGASVGGVQGYRNAVKAGNNGWTGQKSGTFSNDLTDAFGLNKTLDRINNGESFSHRNDGAVFQNRENFLPEKPAGYYHEYVNPVPGINGPGPSRIITGNGGEIYFTPDHYKTFILIR